MSALLQAMTAAADGKGLEPEIGEPCSSHRTIPDKVASLLTRDQPENEADVYVPRASRSAYRARDVLLLAAETKQLAVKSATGNR